MYFFVSCYSHTKYRVFFFLMDPGCVFCEVRTDFFLCNLDEWPFPKGRVRFTVSWMRDLMGWNVSTVLLLNCPLSLRTANTQTDVSAKILKHGLSVDKVQNVLILYLRREINVVFFWFRRFCMVYEVNLPSTFQKPLWVHLYWSWVGFRSSCRSCFEC